MYRYFEVCVFVLVITDLVSFARAWVCGVDTVVCGRRVWLAWYLLRLVACVVWADFWLVFVTYVC